MAVLVPWLSWFRDGGGWASKGIEQLPHLSRIDSAPRAVDCTPDLHLLWNYDVEGRTIPLANTPAKPMAASAVTLKSCGVFNACETELWGLQ